MSGQMVGQTVMAPWTSDAVVAEALVAIATLQATVARLEIEVDELRSCAGCGRKDDK
jgi:hypothetical protein